ncbi:MAG: asparagine synthase (glutamine-hydrolyzing) [Cytophagales bacterium]|nr:asparagine synthase (glutamine-hydrolyzing) [Cytophagales bacterium]MDW8383752.1 asparagine synthase (glutamine-hydrolyzing) [Flammeovirgaceae bacterium]
MCGIAGFFAASLSSEHLKKMTDAIAHRGPDAEGFFIDTSAGVALGHRRLSILDLSSAANQPFFSQCGRYVCIFNGEVYNYREIARELDIKLRTTSDTEVIVEMFAKFGVTCVERFNGMFAIVIYDQKTQTLYFFRDRLGIKPIYYIHQREEIIFASEIKAITALKPSLTLDKTAIANFLYLGYFPEFQTIYQEIHKFPAGYYGIFCKGRFDIKPYWQAEKRIYQKPLSNEVEAKKQFKQLLESSVAYRMISDVPFGAFLSGGTDSSLVTAVAQHISEQPIKTFSIGFKEAKFNEREYARSVANYLHTEHYEFELSEEEAVGQAEQILYYYDIPFADSSAFSTLLVSKVTKEKVTVALSGDGGDELFLGYGMYTWAKRLHHPLVRLMRPLLIKILKNLNDNRARRAALVLDYPSEKRLKSHIFSQEQYYFSEKEIAQLLMPDFLASIVLDENSYIPTDWKPAEKQSLFDIKNYLKDDLLVKVDIASMAYALEVRVPLLDYRIVEFALNLDESLKIRNGIQKYLLKQTLYDYLPQQFFERPKWGFGVPLISWLKNQLKGIVMHYLSEENVIACGAVRYHIVKNLLERYFKGEDYLYNRIWVLVLLHQFLIRHKQTQKTNNALF